MEGNLVKIKLSHTKFRALSTLCNGLLKVWEPVEDPMEELLRQHLIELIHQLDKSLRNPNQKAYTLKLSSSQALAFFLIWRGCTLTDPYSRVILDSIIAAIDKQSKHPAYGR